MGRPHVVDREIFLQGFKGIINPLLVVRRGPATASPLAVKGGVLIELQRANGLLKHHARLHQRVLRFVVPVTGGVIAFHPLER